MSVLYNQENFLVEKYAITLNPGLQLLDPKPWRPKKLNALLVGIWISHKSFSKLPNIQVELEQISSLLPSQSLYNKQFTLSNLQNSLSSSSFSIVHLATHTGFKSNDEDANIVAWDEEYIDANELSELLRPGNQGGSKPIELLVLSACETAAAGEQYVGLGMAGAAVRSGVRSVVAPKWRINDAATVRLMTKFYKELKKPNVTKAEALRRAQIERIRAREAPVDWTPFVLVGNWL